MFMELNKVIRFTVFVWIIFLVLLVFLKRHLFGDGSHFFLEMILKQDFHYVQWSRTFSEKLSQLLPVMAMKGGVINLEVISFLYGMSLFFHSVISIIYCRFLSTNKNDIYVVALSYIFLFMNTSLFIISEAHLCLSLFWILLFSINTDKTSDYKILLIHILVCIGFVRTYESGILFGPLLMLLSALRYRRDGNRLCKMQNIALMGTFGSGVSSFIISGHAILYPRSVTALSGFYTDAISILWSIPFWGSLFIVASIILIKSAILSREKSSKITFLW